MIDSPNILLRIFSKVMITVATEGKRLSDICQSKSLLDGLNFLFLQTFNAVVVKLLVEGLQSLMPEALLPCLEKIFVAQLCLVCPSVCCSSDW